MKLYFSNGACSLADRIIINELELPCDFVAVDLKNKRTAMGEDFFNINPKGAVPTLVTDNDEVLTENAIILQYLADTYQAPQLLPKLGNFGRYHVLEWINFVATELHKSFSALFKPNLPQDIKDTFFIPLIKSKFSYVNNHLGQHKYLFGDHFTLPDAYLMVVYNWGIYFKFDMNEWPHLVRYRQELMTRPSIQKSFKEENLS